MSNRGHTRRTFLISTGGAVAASPARALAPLKMAALADSGIPRVLLAARGVTWLNPSGLDPFSVISEAEGVLIASPDRSGIERIPVDKPLYWCSPFPDPGPWLDAELKKREAAPVGFGSFLAGSDLAAAAAANRRFIRRFRGFCMGSPMPRGVDAIAIHLDFLRVVWPELDLRVITDHLCGFDIRIDEESPAHVTYRYDPGSKCHGWGEQFVLDQGMVEIRRTTGHTVCTSVPSPSYIGPMKTLNRFSASIEEAFHHGSAEIDDFQNWMDAVRSGGEPAISPADFPDLLSVARDATATVQRQFSLYITTYQQGSGVNA